MSREKQIEEMARAMCSFSKNTLCRECSDECFYKDYAERAYNAGYRKQSEGEWVSNRQTDEYICSLCGAIAPVDCLKEDFYKSNFCPTCGAKMKGGAE